MHPPESICPLKAYALGALSPPNLACIMEEQRGPCSPFRRDEGSWRWHKGKGQQSQHVWNSPLGNQWFRQAEATPCSHTGPSWHCQQEGRNQKPGQPLSHWDQSTTGMYKGLWSGHIPDGSCRAGQRCRER